MCKKLLQCRTNPGSKFIINTGRNGREDEAVGQAGFRLWHLALMGKVANESAVLGAVSRQPFFSEAKDKEHGRLIHEHMQPVIEEKRSRKVMRVR